jgi:hypothetical protein
VTQRESRSLPLAVLTQRAFPYTQSQIDLKIFLAAPRGVERRVIRVHLASRLDKKKRRTGVIDL